MLILYLPADTFGVFVASKLLALVGAKGVVIRVLTVCLTRRAPSTSVTIRACSQCQQQQHLLGAVSAFTLCLIQA